MGQEYGLEWNMIEEERGCPITRLEICAGHLLGHLNLQGGDVITDVLEGRSRIFQYRLL